MKSLKRLFEKIAKKNPYWSSYVQFSYAIKKGGFAPQTIRYWFNKLVDKNDYTKEEKQSILKHLLSFSKSG